MSDKNLLILKALKNEELSLRKLAIATSLTERECEVQVSSLLDLEYLYDIDEIINPKTSLKISEKGLAFLEESTIDYTMALKSHLWYSMGSHGGDRTAEILKNKWYPMGSYCKKCGLTTQKFKIKPFMCPK